ncbi:hypothetical protein GQ44DRAFT_417984 [Phaeosphaeriaceae sp. PMI808]|nr:hypothetical protein GQ44DRAFT_417984 [Phaeosphaeriaceae sp. PMI808]
MLGPALLRWVTGFPQCLAEKDSGSWLELARLVLEKEAKNRRSHVPGINLEAQEVLRSSYSEQACETRGSVDILFQCPRRWWKLYKPRLGWLPSPIVYPLTPLFEVTRGCSCG